MAILQSELPYPLQEEEAALVITMRPRRAVQEGEEAVTLPLTQQQLLVRLVRAAQEATAFLTHPEAVEGEKEGLEEMQLIPPRQEQQAQDKLIQ